MAAKKRRTEIQIETHEITIIRVRAVKNVQHPEAPDPEPDIQAYGDNASDQIDTDSVCPGKRSTRKPGVFIDTTKRRAMK